MYQRIIVARDKLLLSRFDTWPIAASIEFDDPTSCWMAIKKWPVIIGIKRWTKKQKIRPKKQGEERKNYRWRFDWSKLENWRETERKIVPSGRVVLTEISEFQFAPVDRRIYRLIRMKMAYEDRVED